MQVLETIFGFFINSAYAADAPPSAGGGFSFVIMLAILISFMYLIVWRPQSKRAREHRDLITNLSKGDEVITAGGILGKVAKITDNYIMLSLTENVEIAVQKSSVANVLPKGTMKSL